MALRLPGADALEVPLTWRQLFQRPELPFAIVQLANYMEPSAQPQQSQWARLRESQHRAALTDPRAELAVAIDLGEASDIHPLRKKELAERCALCFDRLVYNKKVTLSPELVSATADRGGWCSASTRPSPQEPSAVSRWLMPQGTSAM